MNCVALAQAAEVTAGFVQSGVSAQCLEGEPLLRKHSQMGTLQS